MVAVLIVDLTLSRRTEAEMRKPWIAAALALVTTSSHADEVFRFAIGGSARVAVPGHCRALSCLEGFLSYGNIARLPEIVGAFLRLNLSDRRKEWVAR